MLTVLSLGAGVQSSTLALMGEKEIIPKPDVAIFADTGWEPAAVYKHLDWLESQLSYPVIKVSAGNIKNDCLAGLKSNSRFASIPFFLEGKGMGRRQCSNEYKIQPIRKKIRELVGAKPRQRIKGVQVHQYIGISTDEIQRLKLAQDKWIENKWPLVFDLRTSRGDCQAWFAQEYPGRHLPKSSCIGCPYHSNDEWRALTKSEFQDACRFDEAIRNAPKIDKKQFLHRDRIPLRNVDLSTPEEHGQVSWQDECEGICGI